VFPVVSEIVKQRSFLFDEPQTVMNFFGSHVAPAEFPYPTSRERVFTQSRKTEHVPPAPAHDGQKENTQVIESHGTVHFYAPVNGRCDAVQDDFESVGVGHMNPFTAIGNFKVSQRHWMEFCLSSSNKNSPEPSSRPRAVKDSRLSTYTYASIGGHVHTKFLSPYAPSTLPTVAQNLNPPRR